MKLVKDIHSKSTKNSSVSDKEAEEAVIKILEWMGEDPSREGLIETPKRVVKAFKEYFKGYNEDPKTILNKTFGDVDGYDDMVIQKNISVQSHWDIIWHPSLVLLMLLIFQIKESLDLVNSLEL